MSDDDKRRFVREYANGYDDDEIFHAKITTIKQPDNLKYFYFSQRFITEAGENLYHCYYNYGTGRVICGNKVEMIIYLDASQSSGKSWVVQAWDVTTKWMQPISHCEEDLRLGEHGNGTIKIRGELAPNMVVIANLPDNLGESETAEAFPKMQFDM